MTPRAWLWIAVVAAELCALASAVVQIWRVARRLEPRVQNPPQNKTCAVVQFWRRALRIEPHASLVVLLAAAIVIDLVVGLHDPPFGWGLVEVAARGPRPREGFPLLAYHAADALVMAWPALLAATCLRAFGRHVPTVAGRPVHFRVPGHEQDGKAERLALEILVGVYLGAVFGLVALHPLGGIQTARIILAHELVQLVIAGGAIVAGWRRAVAGRATWTRSHGALLVLAPVELAVAVIGPFARPDVFSSWNVARGQYLIAFLLVAALLAWPRRSTARR